MCFVYILDKWAIETLFTNGSSYSLNKMIVIMEYT